MINQLMKIIAIKCSNWNWFPVRPTQITGGVIRDIQSGRTDQLLDLSTPTDRRQQ